jgi:hypothetical protein
VSTFKKSVIKDTAMEFKHHLPANLHNLIFFAEPEMMNETGDQSDENSFGVGAVMPHDMPEFVFLVDTELYGV